MPKRKFSEQDEEYIKYKIKKLERKLLKRRIKHDDQNLSRRHRHSSDRSNIEEIENIEPVSMLSPVAQEVVLEENVAQEISIHLDEDIVTASTSKDTANLEVNETTVLEAIDPDILEILGEDPTSTKIYGKDIQADLALRLKHYTTEGLSKEMRKDLTTKHLTPSNCTLIDPPGLNAEIKAAVSETIIKRDKAIESKQKKLSSAISALSEAITAYISDKNKDPNILRLLMDTIRILCDCQHGESITRKNFILFALKKEIKNQLQTTKIDKYLFGENLPDILKSAKAINRSVSDLKPAPIPTTMPKPQVQYKKPAVSLPKNWKPPLQGRRQPEAQRTMREPAFTTSMKNRPTASSRPLSQRPNQNRR